MFAPYDVGCWSEREIAMLMLNIYEGDLLHVVVIVFDRLHVGMGRKKFEGLNKPPDMDVTERLKLRIKIYLNRSLK